uniref:Uncharacterized protein n=1 Tax=Vespula pensylvanica TaxID=30213 RepID=A0A834UCF7_VESPE|nr:hypothetical protein H0235_006310 [Vespula pensylvanica]
MRDSFEVRSVLRIKSHRRIAHSARRIEASSSSSSTNGNSTGNNASGGDGDGDGDGSAGGGGADFKRFRKGLASLVRRELVENKDS